MYNYTRYFIFLGPSNFSSPETKKKEIFRLKTIFVLFLYYECVLPIDSNDLSIYLMERGMKNLI